MDAITTFTSKVVPLIRDHVDTDQIIPARFLKAIDKRGMDKHLFSDWRYDASGAPRPDFVLNRPEMQGRSVLLVGENFGCGSSREHAPWALTAFGFRAIVARSFADIFRNNALKNGLLPVVLPADLHGRLVTTVQNVGDVEVTIDLPRAMIGLPWGEEAPFPIDPFSQEMLVRGVDELGYLQGLMDKIELFESARPPSTFSTQPSR